MEKILNRLEDIFIVESRNFRSFRPSEFIYDDIQLVLSFRDNVLLANKEILGKKFELQIRTGLQDALAEAIRSDIYKTDTITWQKERTASELRASLELIDVILSDFLKVAAIQEERDYEPYQKRNELIKLLKCFWSFEKLPADLRRASIIVEDYLKLADAGVEELNGWLSVDKYKDIVESISITPCQIILIVLFLEKTIFLQNVRNRGRCLLITDEMIDICPKLREINLSCCVSLD